MAQDKVGAPKSAYFDTEGTFIALMVTDFDASQRWYESNFGLHLLRRSKSPDGAAETAVLEGRNLFVELIHLTKSKLATPHSNDHGHPPGLVKAGVIVSPAAFDTMAQTLRQRGVQFVGDIFQDEEMWARSIIVKDNDGNLIQCFAKKK
jgi:catechol 2,3-dioxygenase-like lactoylglutathione lyase family enzyme